MSLLPRVVCHKNISIWILIFKGNRQYGLATEVEIYTMRQARNVKSAIPFVAELNESKDKTSEETPTCEAYIGTVTWHSVAVLCWIWLQQYQVWWTNTVLNFFLRLPPGHAWFQSSCDHRAVESDVGIWIYCDGICVLTPWWARGWLYFTFHVSRRWGICSIK